MSQELLDSLGLLVCVCVCMYHLFYPLLRTSFFSLLLEREEGERKGLHRVLWVNCSLGMCPDGESNLQLFSYRMMLQPTEPQWLGHVSF